MGKSIEFKCIYNHPIQKVWKALTDKEALSIWLMPCNFEPIIGYEFQFRTKASIGFDGIVHCKVLELVDQQVLSFSWKNGNLNTVVRFELKEEDGKTTLHFKHSGFQGIFENYLVKKILNNGWRKKILAQYLPKYLSND